MNPHLLRCRPAIRRLLALALMAFMATSLRVQAQTFRDLHDFGSIPADGLLAYGRPMFYGTGLFGTTLGPNDGTMYKISLENHQYSVIYTFHGADGSAPFGGLYHRPGDGSGNQYGCATGGGNGSGTIFQFNIKTDVLTTLYTFTPATTVGGLRVNTDGAYPLSVQYGSGGYLYGVCAQGGANGTGTLFKWSPSTGLIVLHTFGALNGSGQNSDGAFPQQGMNMGLNGVTPYGGSNGAGVLYHITPSGTFMVLHTFRDNADGSDNGYQPVGTPLLAGNILYGATTMGGANLLAAGGAIYQYSFNTRAYTQLYLFSPAPSGTNSDGADPLTPLIRDLNGNLYGACYGGGANGEGTVFRFTPSTSAYTVLHTFAGGSADGSGPAAPLVLISGALYSTTLAGGSANGGVFFELTP
ncbi:MAG TPA: choice-of-anchor tandem repeat GloVer-containing protein [Chthonomonadaceae bacterium]|nr:choice-of-anchor tandem repeat GloVer-containing protein [Chthonomonadaceae bacterium]